MDKERNAVIEAKEMSDEELEALLKQEEQGLEEADQDAELSAQSDAVSRNEEAEIREIDYVVRFKKPYLFNGKEIDQVDMSGLEELTTMDAQLIDREMAKLNHYPKAKFRDTLYCKHIAMRVTGLPADFFNMLRWKDINEIISTVTWYFLFG